MLSNFNEPIWPRTIATKFTNGAQIPVQNKEEALQLYKDSNFIDCRISAYPYNNNNNNSCNNHIKSQLVNFVLIDIDISIFNYSKQALEKQLKRMLKNINKVFGLVPSVVWSGNGYHIYIQIESLNTALEETPEFSRFKVRFVERYLSNNKCDSVHNNTVSFSNCMLRIPNSLNSKCIEGNNQVTIKQRWDNKSRLPAKLLLGDFLTYLLDEKRNKEQELAKKCAKPHHPNSSNNNNSLPIDWIELLLQTRLEDYRKYCIWRILSPYLIVKRKIGYNESYNIIQNWLNECEKLQPFNFDSNLKINEGLDGALNIGCYPISLRFKT